MAGMSRRLYEVAKECGRQPDELFDACRALYIQLDRFRPQYTILTEAHVDRVLDALESAARQTVDSTVYEARRLRLERRRLRAEQEKAPHSTVFLRAMVHAAEGQDLSAENLKLEENLLALAEPGPHPLVKRPRVAPATPPRMVRVAVVSAAPDLKLLEALANEARHTEVQAIQLDRNEPENWQSLLRREPLARFHGMIVVERLLGQTATGFVRENVRAGCIVVGIERFAVEPILDATKTIRRAVETLGTREGRP
jgi:hypothetical protein